MALHLSGKLLVVAAVMVALITAFTTPNLIDISVNPKVTVTIVKPQPVVDENAPLAGPEASYSLTVKSTAYNSLVEQTDDTPHITAIGTTTRFGIIAVSRDLLGQNIPYGSLVRLKDLGSWYNGRGYGKYQTMLDRQGLFIVEDTMNPRKTNQIDVWFPHMSDALNWGVRQVELEVVRYGWDGPELVAQTGYGTEFSMR
ncbi:MAG: 3D domain-containing protein [Trueperaceae bacterium]|nr:3D domain-containing protein [Trueperaceae bacterium]